MGIDEETIKQTSLMKLSDQQMNKIKFAEFQTMVDAQKSIFRILR